MSKVAVSKSQKMERLIKHFSSPEVRVSTEEIAVAFECDHAFVMRDIRRNQCEFDQFGKVVFQWRTFSTVNGAHHKRKFAWLNRDQALMLVLLMHGLNEAKFVFIKHLSAIEKELDELNGEGMSNFLDIKNVAIRATENGHSLYRLNDFHEVAMKDGLANRNKAPGEWARYAGAEFLKEYTEAGGARNGLSVPRYIVVQGGSGEQGTYGDETVVCRYAAYLSVKFEVHVYEFFTQMKLGKQIVRDAPWLDKRGKQKKINVETRAKITSKGGGSKDVHIKTQRRIGKAATGLYPADLRKARNVPSSASPRDFWRLDEIISGSAIEMAHNENLDKLSGPEEILEDVDRVCTLFEGFKKAARLK